MRVVIGVELWLHAHLLTDEDLDTWTKAVERQLEEMELVEQATVLDLGIVD